MDILERHGDGSDGLLVRGDNLEVAGRLAGGVRLLYLDPPFATGNDFTYAAQREGRRAVHRAYADRWGGLRGYRDWIAPRLEAAVALLAQDGALYLHCDTRACHVLRCLLDDLLGESRFRAQIAWRRTTSHPDARFYGSVHDVILVYADARRHVMNQVRVPLDPAYVEQYYRYRDPDGRRFMSDNLTGAGDGPPRDFGERGVLPPPPGRHWLTDQAGVDRLLAEGRIFWTRNGVPRLKKYLDEADGVPAGDVWTDIQALRSWHRREATGYPTQKPEALLERILLASSGPGDLVADLFCGSGTALAVAQRLGRRWVGCDVGSHAVELSRRRLLAAGAAFDVCGPLETGEVGTVAREGARLRLLSGPEAVDWWGVQWGASPGPFRPDWCGFRSDDGRLPVVSEPGPSGAATVRLVDTGGRRATLVL